MAYDRNAQIKSKKSGCELEVMVGVPHKTRDVIQHLVIFQKMCGDVWMVSADFMSMSFENPAKALEDNGSLAPSYMTNFNNISVRKQDGQNLYLCSGRGHQYPVQKLTTVVTVPKAGFPIKIYLGAMMNQIVERFFTDASDDINGTCGMNYVSWLKDCRPGLYQHQMGTHPRSTQKAMTEEELA